MAKTTRTRASKAPPAPKTRDEWIAHEIARFSKPLRPFAEPTWTVKVGEKVTVGSHYSSEVVAIVDDGRIVVTEHFHDPKRERTNMGAPNTGAPFYNAHAWFDVFPIVASQTEGPWYAKRLAWNHHVPTHMSGLIRRATMEELRDNPDYQRGYVWGDEDRDLFIEAMFRGRELGLFIFVQFPSPDYFYDVLDGKQRLNCLKDFFQGRFRYEGRLWYEFSNHDRAIVQSTMTQYVELDGGRMKRSELLEVFLEVNAGGVPQTPAHLDHVRTLLAEAKQQERAGI